MNYIESIIADIYSEEHEDRSTQSYKAINIERPEYITRALEMHRREREEAAANAAKKSPKAKLDAAVIKAIQAYQNATGGALVGLWVDDELKVRIEVA